MMEDKLYEDMSKRIRQVEIDIMKIWKACLRFGKDLRILERKVYGK